MSCFNYTEKKFATYLICLVLKNETPTKDPKKLGKVLTLVYFYHFPRRALIIHIRSMRCFQQIALNVSEKGNQLGSFNGLFDLAEQAVIRRECKSTVGKFDYCSVNVG